MFPAQTKQIEKGTTSEPRDMTSIVSEARCESQPRARFSVHTPRESAAVHRLRIDGEADAARRAAWMHIVKGASVDPVTEAEASRAIGELRAQYNALARVRDTVVALTAQGITEVMPANWSGASSRAYELRLDDLSAQLSWSESSLNAALDAVRHDIARVQADAAASIDSDRMEGSR